MPEWLVIDPATQQALLVALASVVTMVVAQLIKRFVSWVPNKWLPMIAPIVGGISASLIQVSSDPGVNAIIGVIAGSAAVGFNQIPKQAAKPD